MRVNQRAIQEFFFSDRTADEVIEGYGVDRKADRDTAEELKRKLCKDKNRFLRGIEVFVSDCDRNYTKFLQKNGYTDLKIVR